MYRAVAENDLILPDIAYVMADHVSIQLDIDERKIKAASMIAQDIDILRVIKREGIERCLNPQTEADEQLKALIIKPLCFYTYARALKMFQGTLTDSGYTTEAEAEDRYTSKSVGKEMDSIAETYMNLVAEFLEDEDPTTDENIKDKIKSRKIRAFGGVEYRR